MVTMGLLAPGASPLSASGGKGINETWKGRVHLLDGSTVPAYVKLLSQRQLVNELFGAELARAVGMPVPETYLVRVDKGDYAAMFAQHNIQTDAVIAFGCRDVGVKSLARRYQAEGMALRQALEDAWADAALLRRWQRFALQLDEAQCERLVRIAGRLGLGGKAWQWLPGSAATEGWALPAGGQSGPPPGWARRTPPVKARSAAPTMAACKA